MCSLLGCAPVPIQLFQSHNQIICAVSSKGICAGQLVDQLDFLWDLGFSGSAVSLVTYRHDSLAKVSSQSMVSRTRPFWHSVASLSWSCSALGRLSGCSDASRSLQIVGRVAGMCKALAEQTPSSALFRSRHLQSQFPNADVSGQFKTRW